MLQEEEKDKGLPVVLDKIKQA